MGDRLQTLLGADVEYPPGWTPATPSDGRRARPAVSARWAVGAAVLVVVAVVTVVVAGWHPWRPDGAGTTINASKPPAAQANSAPASSEDRGSVSVITVDATCSQWSEVRGPVEAARGGWARRDATLPRRAWDPARRAQIDAMGVALETAADRTAILARQTPHRVMRELYGTFMSYGRDYAAALPSYQPVNDLLGRTALAAFDAVTNVCAAADGSSWAILRAQMVPPVAAPTAPTPIGDLDRPTRFLSQPGPTCSRWVPGDTALREQTKSWSTVDPQTTADEWDAAQRSAVERTAQVGTAQADDMEAWGRAAGNPVFEDLAVLGAQYFRAYELGVPTYRPSDNAFAHVGFDVSGLIAAACQAGPA